MAQEQLNTKEIEVEFRSTNNMGIKPVDGNWINFDSETSSVQKEEMRTLIGQLSKGDKIKIEMVGEKNFTNFEITEKAPAQQGGQEIVSFKTLIEKFHKEGGTGIVTKEVMHDPENKIATFKAIVYKEIKGRKQAFTAHGDASPANVGEKIKIHYYRMAESRAISRALRFALGEGDVADTELEEGNNESAK